MWTRIGNPLEEFPEWVQPIGAHDAYSKGANGYLSMRTVPFYLAASAGEVTRVAMIPTT